MSTYSIIEKLLLIIVVFAISCTQESNIDKSVKMYSIESINNIEMSDAVGAILDVVIANDKLYIIDDITMNILQYTFTTSDIDTIMGIGPGPYELTQPRCLASNRHILYIADDGRREIYSYNDGQIEKYPYGELVFSIEKIAHIDDDGYIAITYSVARDEDTIKYVKNMAKYTYTGDIVCVYLQEEWIMPSAYYWEQSGLSSMICDRSVLCIAQDVTDYRVVINTDSLIELRGMIGRQEKTETELEQEIQEFEMFLASNDYVMYNDGFTPYPYRNIIYLTGIDLYRRIWIQRYEQNALEFDVWTEEGEYSVTYRVQVSGDPDEYASRIVEDNLVIYTLEYASNIEILCIPITAES